MDVTKTNSSITKYLISDVVGLDPIRVYIENYELGQGRIIINCYATAWTAYWAAMGNNTLETFVANSDPGYIAENLTWGYGYIKDNKNHDEYIVKIVKVVQQVLREDLNKSIDK